MFLCGGSLFPQKLMRESVVSSIVGKLFNMFGYGERQMSSLNLWKILRYGA
jgi:hypothetical protein